MAEHLIALHRRNGDIAGHVRVDADVYREMSPFMWHMGSRGYARRNIGRTAILLHRLVMGAPPFDGAEVDHISRDRLDCRRINMRWVSHAQNLQNKPSYKGATSTARGVWWDKREQRWRASVRLNGRRVWHRRFTDEAEAATAVIAARRQFLPYTNEAHV